MTRKPTYTSRKIAWPQLGMVALILLVAVLSAMQNTWQGITVAVLMVAMGIVVGIRFSVGHWLQHQNRLHLQQLAQDHQPAEESNQGDVWPEIDQLGQHLKEAVAGIEALSSSQPLPDFQHLDLNHGLGKALLGAQDRMQVLQQSEARRTWIVEGLARFAELVRHDFEDKREFGLAVLRLLIEYLKCNQAGFYLAVEEDEKPTLQLLATYAYDRQKHRYQTVHLGEGILGQALLEKKMVYLDTLPNNYVHISSGLGHASPRNVVVVPLVLRSQMFGAIELASFNTLEEHQLDFLQQLSENLAGSLADQLGKERTQGLLGESQKLARELQEQEQEMRESLEELQVTQDQMHSKQAELAGVVTAVDTMMGLAQVDQDGNFVQFNAKFAEVMRSQRERVENSNLFDYWDRDWYDQKVVPRLHAGESLKLEHQGQLRGETVWWHTSFAPMLDARQAHYGTMILTENITLRKQRELDFERLSMVADHTTNSVVISDAEGRVEYVNQGFTALTGYSLDEMRGHKPGHLLQGDQTDPQTVQRIREGLNQSEPVVEEILNYTKAGKPYWVSLVINPVLNQKGVLSKFVAIQADITATKMQSLDFQHKLDAFNDTNLLMEFDLTGQVTTVNALTLEAFGYTEAEMLRQPIGKWIPAMQPDRQWRDLTQRHLPPNQVYEAIGKDGVKLWLRGTFSTIYNHVDQPLKYLLFATDITTERQFQRQTQRQQAELQGTLSAISQALASCTFNMAGQVQEANPIFASIMGTTPQDLIGLSHTELLPLAEREKPQHTMMWANLRDGQAFTGEFTLRDRQGNTLWLTGSYSTINDSEGQPYKVVMIAQFTTHEKEKRKELEGALKAMQQTLPVLEIKPGGQVKTANALFMERFGFTRKTLFGKPLHELIQGMSPATWPQVVETLQQEGRETCQWTLRHQPDLYWVNVFPIYNLANELLKVICFWEAHHVPENQTVPKQDQSASSS